MSVVNATETEVGRLIEQLHAGDPDALSRLYAEYGGVVRAAVRRRLPDSLRQEYDSLDFTQDVWASICRMGPGQHRFATADELGGFLARVAYNKVIDVCRRKGTNRADVTREQPFGRTETGADVPLPGREATPSQWAIADERWAAIAAALPPAHAAVIARLREGYTQEEVAAMAGVSDRTVRRIVDRVRELCEDRS